MSEEVVELETTLFFKNQPTIVIADLCAAWELEGYACQPFDPEQAKRQIGAFRGPTANAFGDVKPVTGDEVPAYYEALLAAKVPYDETFLINHPQAIADYRACRYKVDLTFRMMKEETLVTHSNELAITLLGVQQTLPVEAIWFEHLGIFVGRKNLVEYTNYQNSQGGAKTSFPYPLFFGTLVGNGRAWTTGLSQFGHKDIFIEEDSFDAMRTLFNVGISVVNGTRFQPGETMETAHMRYRIEDGELAGEPALRFA
jgi:hypothetical protein